MSLLVEFLGLPGVGKSVLAACTAQELIAAGNTVAQPSGVLAHAMGPVRRRCYKLLHALREVALHPLASARSIAAITGSGQHSVAAWAKLIVNWLLVVDLLRGARRRPGLHLFDQGLLQAVWSVALDGDLDKAMRLLQAAFAASVLPQVAVVVEADPATVQQRLQQRPGASSRVERDLERTGELLQRGERILERIRAALAAQRSIQVITAVNGGGADLAPMAHRLATDLAGLDHAAGGAPVTGATRSD